MIKKLTFLSLIILTMLFASLQVQATYVQSQALNITSQFSTWTIRENAGVYMLESNRVKNSAVSVEIQLDTYFSASTNPLYDADGDGLFDDPNPYYMIENAFVMSYGTETSRINIYSNPTTTTLLSTVNMTYEAPEVTEIMFLNGGSMVDPDWIVEITEGVYYSMTIVLNETLTSDQRSRILSVFNAGGYWGNMVPGDTYNLVVTANVVSVYIDPLNPGDLDLLPETAGSIFDEVNMMGRVSIDNINNYTVDFSLSYDTIYQMRYTFSENTDMTIFNNNYEAFYYTHEGQRFIVFNKGDESLFTTSNWKTQTFVPYSIWNLNTNEIVRYDQLNVYMYMKLGDANHLIAYFYVDDFVIDRLIQVSTLFNYRWDPLIGEKSSWIPQAIILEDTNISEGNTSWQFDAMATSATATAVLTAIAASIPGGQPVAFGIFIVGSIVTLYFEHLADNYPGSLIVGDTSEITLASPDYDTLNEINAKYKELNPDFSEVNLSLWKLDFGAYDKFGNTPEVDPDSIKVISMTYQTDGMLYTLESENINTLAAVDDYLDPHNDSTILNPYPTQPSTGFNLPEGWYYYVGALVGGYFLFKVFDKAKKEPGLMILLLAVAAYLLYILGVF